MLEKIKKSPFLELFSKTLSEERSLLFENLWDCPKAILACKAIEALGKSCVIITGSDRQDKLLDDLQFFSLAECLEFPSWEILPTEEIPPSADIVGKRFEILEKISHSHENKIVVTNLQAALQKIPPFEILSSQCRHIKVKDRWVFEKIEMELDSLG